VRVPVTADIIQTPLNLNGSFYGFPIASKSYGTDRRTNKQGATVGLQHAVKTATFNVNVILAILEAY